MLSALEAVDLVVLFGEDTPIELIRRVAPTILVKGADYRVDQVVGHELVEAHGGEVLLVGLAEGHSTTKLIGDGSGKPLPKPPAPAKKPVDPKNAQKKYTDARSRRSGSSTRTKAE